MTLTQMQYVVKTSEIGSMNRAAKTLNVSQPSLSKAIGDLEEEIGFRLFFRTNKGILVTSEGQDFIAQAHQIVDAFQKIEQKYVEKP